MISSMYVLNLISILQTTFHIAIKWGLNENLPLFRLNKSIPNPNQNTCMYFPQFHQLNMNIAQAIIIITHHKFWVGPLTLGGLVGWGTVPWTWDTGLWSHSLSAEHFCLVEIHELKKEYTHLGILGKYKSTVVVSRIGEWKLDRISELPQICQEFLHTFITRLRPE